MESNDQNIPGVLEWIGIREKSGSIKSVQHVLAIEDLGLKGDKITLKGSKKRQVTLMQKEHISVILSLAGEKDQLKIDSIQYYFKRNLLVSKCNIQNLKGKLFNIGGAKFYGTGDCKPCKKIDLACTSTPWRKSFFSIPVSNKRLSKILTGSCTRSISILSITLCN